MFRQLSHCLDELSRPYGYRPEPNGGFDMEHGVEGDSGRHQSVCAPETPRRS